MAELFGSVLGLCAKAGLVGSGVVAVDGTKLSASASRDANVDYDRIAREIIAEAIATDEAEDEQHGDARGDELPPELQTEAGRREWLARDARAGASGRGETARTRVPSETGARWTRFDAERIVARVQGREGWLREAKRQLEQDALGGPQRRSRGRGLSGCAGGAAVGGRSRR